MTDAHTTVLAIVLSVCVSGVATYLYTSWRLAQRRENSDDVG
jgi:hypothetical protein